MFSCYVAFCTGEVKTRLEDVSQDLRFEGGGSWRKRKGWVGGWVGGRRDLAFQQSASATNTTTTSLLKDFKRKIRKEAESLDFLGLFSDCGRKGSTCWYF